MKWWTGKRILVLAIVLVFVALTQAFIPLWVAIGAALLLYRSSWGRPWVKIGIAIILVLFGFVVSIALFAMSQEAGSSAEADQAGRGDLVSGVNLQNSGELVDRPTSSVALDPKTQKILENFSGGDGQLETVTVKRVIDGDTVELSDGRRVRYIGIDTAELSDARQPQRCYASVASAKNRELVEGKQVRLERDISDIDPYGRLLRYIYVDDVFVNEALVRGGYANVSIYPPDVKYIDQFLAAEAYARENELGFWGSECADISESDSAGSPQVDSASSPQAGSEGSISTSGGQCVVKGNISSEKIYHLPGCQSYEKTVIDTSAGERWFCSESEAVEAGWRKARNC